MSYKFKDNKYTRWYFNIIENAVQRNLIEDIERHHIIPKALYGTNDKMNIAPLTMREHFICHLLLVRMVKPKDVYKMVHAVIRFTTKAQNSAEYELLRKTVSRFSKGEYNTAYGRMWVYEKDTQNILFIPKEEFDEDIHIQGLPFQRGGHSGYVWINNGKTEAMVGKGIKLADAWEYGRLHKPGLKHMKRMASLRHTKEKDKEHSEKLKGRVAITDGFKTKRVGKEGLQNYLVDGWYMLAKPKFVSNVKITYNGIGKIYKSISEFCTEVNINYSTLRSMVSRKNLPYKGVEKIERIKVEL